MAKTKKRKGRTGQLADILAQSREAFANADPMGVAPFVPEVGTYKAHLCGFAADTREARDGAGDYLSIRVTVAVDSSPYNGRECNVTFNSLTTGQSKKTQDIWSLKRFKGLTAILNEGDPIEDLESAIDYVQSCCDDQVPVVLSVDEFQLASGKMRRGANISELDLSATATEDSEDSEDSEDEGDEEESEDD